MVIISLTSCGIMDRLTLFFGDDTEDTQDGTDPSTDIDETDGETAADTKNDKNEPSKKEYNGTYFAGFSTADSFYDGEFNSKVGWKAAGMGYVVKTENGKMIAIDGGNTADAFNFYRFLAEYSPTDEVVIDYWIITHPHGDHINALIAMMENRFIDIKVKNFIYYFPEGFNDASCIYYISEMKRVTKHYGANVITPKKGQKIKLDNVELEFYYVPTDYTGFTSGNQLSLIFSITADKRVMITGDAFENGLKAAANSYGSKLKCDILQMPHHFLCDTGYQAFYDYVGANTLILPTCISGYEAMTSPTSEYKNNSKYKINKKVHDNAATVYKAFEKLPTSKVGTYCEIKIG